MNKIIYYIVLFFTGCTSYNDVNHNPTFETTIKDTPSWYDDLNSNVKVIKLTYATPNKSLCAPYTNMLGTPRPCTLDDVNHDTDVTDKYIPSLNVKMSADNFTTNVENATIKIRGNFSRQLAQKNYAVKLVSKINLLEKQRKFNLNKHQADRSRVKNKLAMDLIHEIPNIPGVKTQFVNLFINGKDYGLFTHVESIRYEYLINRGWNKDDNIYNAVNFMFIPQPVFKTDAKGVPLDPDAFNQLLEIKNGKNHSKVAEMLNAIATTNDINQVIDKYFDRDNYITWLAIQLIFGNKDSIQHNYYLYNPVYSDKFYFLPWDFDGAWGKPQYLSKYEYGLSLWWNVPLHQKFFLNPDNLAELEAKVDELRSKYITDANVQAKLDSYEPSVHPFMLQEPDTQNDSERTWRKATDALLTGITDNIALYRSVNGHPMPFHQYYNNGVIKWEKSVDLEGDEIVYDLKIADNPEMNNSIISYNDLSELSYTLTPEDKNLLPTGSYYLQVISKEKNNPEHYQVTYDKPPKINGIHYYGIISIDVNSSAL